MLSFRHTKQTSEDKADTIFKFNIWTADLAETESLSSKYRSVKYLLCVIDIFVKYAWVGPIKNKKGKTVLNALIELVNESNCERNKL